MTLDLFDVAIKDFTKAVEGEVSFKTLFYFAKLFDPAIICLDDLDLLVSVRSRGHFIKTGKV